MKLAFSPAARRDLVDIGDYIARDSRRQAFRFVDGLERFCATLVSQPERYPHLARHAARGIRRAPYQHYLIFYRVGADRVEVLRMLHAARDIDPVTENL